MGFSYKISDLFILQRAFQRAVVTGGTTIIEADGLAVGSSTVQAQSQVIFEAIGSSIGAATVQTQSQAIAETVGYSIGAAAVSGVGQAIAEAVANAVGTSTVSALSEAIFEAVGNSAGVSTADAAGEDAGTPTTIIEAEGYSAGTSTVQADGKNTAIPVLEEESPRGGGFPDDWHRYWIAYVDRRKLEEDKQQALEEAERISAEASRQLEIEAQQKARKRVSEYQQRKILEATDRFKQAEAAQLRADIEKFIADLEAERTAQIALEAKAELDRIKQEQADEEEAIAMLMAVMLTMD